MQPDSNYGTLADKLNLSLMSAAPKFVGCDAEDPVTFTEKLKEIAREQGYVGYGPMDKMVEAGFQIVAANPTPESGCAPYIVWGHRDAMTSQQKGSKAITGGLFLVTRGGKAKDVIGKALSKADPFPPFAMLLVEPGDHNEQIPVEAFINEGIAQTLDRSNQAKVKVGGLSSIETGKPTIDAMVKMYASKYAGIETSGTKDLITGTTRGVNAAHDQAVCDQFGQAFGGAIGK